MAAGQGFKTFTTGEVLTAGDVNGYLMQGINVFTNATARDAAITAPAEGQFAFTKDNNSLWYYDGAAWVASGATGDIEGVTAGVGISGGGTSGTVTITNSMATEIAAKGDLIVGTGSQTFDNLTVGTNGQVLTADSTAATGLAWATASGGGSSNVAGKNVVLNSAFNVWQRGTSVTFANGKPYGADRWQAISPSGSTSATFSQQATNDTTNLPNIRYAGRIQRTAGNAVQSPLALTQCIETENSVPYAGKQVTLSFYARRGANFSGSSNNLSVYLYTGTGTDQNINTSYTGLATPISNQTAALTTTWQRFTFTATLASTATEIAMEFTYTPLGTAGAADYFEITGVQLEIAGSASAYSPNGATYEAELAACQRYYQRITVQDSTGRMSGVTPAATTNTVYMIIQHGVQFRSAPTSLDYSLIGLADGVNSIITPSSLGLNNAGVNNTIVQTTASGLLTQMRSYFFIANSSTSAYLGFSAEL